MELLQNFTQHALDAARLAEEEAKLRRDRRVGSAHLLLGLLREEEGFAGKFLRDKGLSVERARSEIERIYGSAEGEDLCVEDSLTTRAHLILSHAEGLAQSFGGTTGQVKTGHVLYALLCNNGGVIFIVFSALNVNCEELLREITPHLQGVAV